MLDKADIVEEKVEYHDIDGNNKFLHSPEEKAFLKRLNLRVLPIVFLIIFIQFCDKSALSVAAVLGMKDDVHMTGNQYNWLGSMFYLGYLVCQVPSNFLIQRLPVGRYLGGMLILWGVTMGCTGACNSYAQLLAVRFLLGLFEGVSYPCLYIILNTLYRRSEQPAVWGFIGVSTGSGTVLGVAIAYGLAHMEGLGGLRAWRWTYIVFGIATCLIGFITFFFLVDDTKHKLLNVQGIEFEIIEERARDNSVVRVREIKRYQIIEALCEPRLYLLGFAFAMNCLQNGGLVTFSTLLVNNLGFSETSSIILQIPSGIAAAVTAIGGVMLAKRLHRVVFTGMLMAFLSLLGCLLLIALPGEFKLAGYYLSWTMTGVNALLTTLLSNNVAGYSKKVFYNAVVITASTIGNFCGPLMMTANQAPEYYGGLSGYLVANALIIICLAALYVIMNCENKRRAVDLPVMKSDPHMDLTDKEDCNIKYIL